MLDDCITNTIALQQAKQRSLHNLHFSINARLIHEFRARVLAPGRKKLFCLPQSAGRFCHGDTEYREGAGGCKFDGNKSSRLIGRLQLRRAVLGADEVEFPGMAFGRSSFHRGNQGILIRDYELGTSIWRRNAAISGRKANRAVENPQRFNIWLDFWIWLYERDLHGYRPSIVDDAEQWISVAPIDLPKWGLLILTRLMAAAMAHLGGRVAKRIL